MIAQVYTYFPTHSGQEKLTKGHMFAPYLLVSPWCRVEVKDSEYCWCLALTFWDILIKRNIKLLLLLSLTPCTIVHSIYTIVFSYIIAISQN